jgi:hypothetical protein
MHVHEKRRLSDFTSAKPGSFKLVVMVTGDILFESNGLDGKASNGYGNYDAFIKKG